MNLKKSNEKKYEKGQSEYAPIERTTIKVNEVAEYLGLSKDFIYKLCRERKIPKIKIGSRIMFKKDTIDKWLSDLEEESHDY